MADFFQRLDSRVEEPCFPTRTGAAWFYLLLLAIVFASYAPVLTSPFVQDEYDWIYSLSHRSAGEMLSASVDPAGRLFYRPLSSAYHVAVFHAFGPGPLPWRVGALLFLSMNAFLVALVIHVFTRDRVVACGAALLYAAASSIFMDAVMWLSGINELGGAFCTLLALLCFFRDRHGMGAVFCLGAMLFKEAAAYVPALILVCYLWRESPGRPKFWKLWPYGAAALLYFCTKLEAVPTTGLPDAHPYALRLRGPHLWTSLLTYATWLANVVAANLPQAHVAGVVSFAAVVLVLIVARMFPLAAWLVLSLMPVFFFPNHVYRYYLIAGLPPFLACVLLALRRATGRRAVLALWVAFNVVAGGAYFHRRLAEGLNQQYCDGTNWLVRKAAITRLVRKTLRDKVPHPAADARFVFAGLETEAFGRSHGPRLWYGDDSLVVCGVSDVGINEGGSLVIGRSGPRTSSRSSKPPLALDPTNSHAFLLENGRLVDRTKQWRSYCAKQLKRQSGNY